MAISASDVKSLRESTGAGMMDCKKALEESGGNMDKAVAWLRERGIAKAAKRGDKVASEGAVQSYIHMGGKVGVLVEVNCETDFVARGDDFQELCRNICLQICSTAPLAVRHDELSAAVVAAEKDLYVKQAAETGKPQDICEKIAEGKLKKWFSEVCLMDQPFVKDPDKTIDQIVTELSGKVGEKITVRRFVRYQLGEGIEKAESNFAEEVAAELEKASQKN
ncbi:MAG: translation elongation factor Ts [Candidatus Hydrogenedentes bacterium]|nr:translation elongation factor Ts [Candidatus Hydrogenedentota bacterium]